MTLPRIAPRRGTPDRVAALVHDIDRDMAPVEMGTMRRWAGTVGIDLEVVTTADPMPDPALLDGLVVFGSEQSAYDDAVPWLADELAVVEAAVSAGTPVLGICFGGQLLSRVLGGSVGPAEVGEFGWTHVQTDDEALVPAGPWLEFHFDAFTIPPGGVEIARTALASQAFTYGPHLGVQFHPEITPEGFDTWAAAWNARGFDQELPALGLELDGLRADVRRWAGTSADASMLMFDAFWRRAQRIRNGSMID